MTQNEYIALFLQEAEEQIDHIENHLITLKEDTKAIHEIFRMAHSLKGSAGMMGLKYMHDLSHNMESLLSDIRDDKITVSDEIELALLKALDQLRYMHTCFVTDPLKAELCASKCTDCQIINDQVIQQIKDILTPKHSVYKIKVYMSKTAQMKSIKAYLIMNNIKDVCSKILEVTPQDYETRADNEFPNVFEIRIESIHEEDKIMNTVDSVSEIDKIEVAREEENEQVDKKNISKSNQEEALIPTALIHNIPEDPQNQEFKIKTSAMHLDPSTTSHKSDTPQAQPSKKGKSNIRVDMDKLDTLMRLVSEFVIEKEALNQMGKDLKRRCKGDSIISRLNESLAKVNYIGSELQETILSTRMLPLEQVFNRFPRMIRDLSQKLGKEIEFHMEGMETEIDRSITEELIDPITHLLRNSADHGIKEKGIISLTAKHTDGKVVIKISDTGRGIDLDRIKNKAIEKNLVSYEQLSAMSDKEIVNLIFKPGFSTAETVTDVSGRGVGLDVVKNNIAKLHGTVDVSTQVNQGTTFTIKLPLTLAITQAMLVKEQKHIYAIPVMSIIETVRILEEEHEKLQDVNGFEMYLWRDLVIPVIRLTDVFNLSKVPRDKDFLVIVGIAEKRIAFAVEKLIGTQDIVIKSVGNNLLELMTGISGVSILGDGSFAQIIDIDSLHQYWLQSRKEGKSA